jgi:hypothetical protein
MEVGPYIRAALAAGLTGEARLDVGQPNIIWPPITPDRGPMRAVIVAAINQQAANAGGAHLSEGDLLAGFGHALLKPGPGG